MEPPRATQGTSGFTRCDRGKAFSPMAPSHFPCHWQRPLEQDFLTALSQSMTFQSLAHEKQVLPGQASAERSKPGSLCPATSPENHSLLGRRWTPIHCVPQCRPCRPRSPRGLLSGREVKGEQGSLTHTLQRDPPSPLLSTPQPGFPYRFIPLIWVKGPRFTEPVF